MYAFYDQLQRAAEEAERGARCPVDTGSARTGAGAETVMDNSEYGSDQAKEDFEALADAAGNICTLAEAGRTEGLLALEEAVSDIDDEFLKRCIMLVVDGTDPERVEQTMLMAAITSGDHGAKKLRNLISLRGTLMVQQGENPRTIEETLSSMIPPFLAPETGKDYPVSGRWVDKEDPPDGWTPSSVIWRAIESRWEFHRGQLGEMNKKSLEEREAEDEKKREDFFAAPFSWKPGQCGYVAASCFDLMLCSMSDADVQIFLRGDRLRNDMFITASKGMSGDMRKRLWDNLPEGYGNCLLWSYNFDRPTKQGNAIGAMLELSHIVLDLARFEDVHLVKDGQDMREVAEAALDAADEAFARRFGLDGRTGKPIDPSKQRKDEPEVIARLRSVLASYDAGDMKLM